MKMPQRSVGQADVGWMLLAGLIVLLQFWWLPGDGGTVADSFSSTMEGSRGLYETLSELADDGHLPPVRREARQLVPQTPCVLLLLGPDRYPDDHEQEQLRDFVRTGGTLLYAANREVPGSRQPELHSTVFGYRLRYRDADAHGLRQSPAATASGNSSSDGTPPTAQAQLQSQGTVPPDSSGPNPAQTAPAAESMPATVPAASPVVPQDLPLIRTTSPLIDGQVSWRSNAVVSSAPRHAEKLVVDEDGQTQAVAWWVGRGTFVLCASADPFSNRSMIFASQAALAVRLVEYGCAQTAAHLPQQEIVVSEYLNGAGSYTGSAVMVSPLLRSGTLQLSLTAVLLAWSGFHRFGPPLRVRRGWRRSLAASAEAVGNLQFMANDGSTCVRQYFDWVSGEIRGRTGDLPLQDDAADLARRSGWKRKQVQLLLENVRRKSEQATVPPAEAAAVIRRLARFRQNVFSANPHQSSSS